MQVFTMFSTHICGHLGQLYLKVLAQFRAGGRLMSVLIMCGNFSQQLYLVIQFRINLGQL